MRGQIEKEIRESISVKERCIPLAGDVERTATEIISCLKSGNKVMLCGNGGSAADCQHVAGEFVNKFRFERKPLPAIALTTDSSILTCIGNDSSFDDVFEKQVDALGNKGDVLIGISTSGNSKNVIRAFEKAKEKGIRTVALTGASGGRLKDCSDMLLNVPSSDTPRIQEAHITMLHIICGLVEQAIFKNHMT
ncbi:MAG: D-sedoheptulose 7-phosphate isomerase [Candidatus Aenigmarchaeota archaeon]|nr:D-sedoheptulose 7-phosphate isomerase [Candidatus Aenigmarchaeota archaeon]